MNRIHYRYNLKAVRRNPDNGKYKEAIYGSTIFVDNNTLLAGRLFGEEDDQVFCLDLNNANDINSPRPEWKPLFSGVFHNPMVRGDFLFFEQYSGLGYKQPPEIFRINLIQLKKCNPEVIPEKHLPGKLVKLFGLPDKYLATKPKKKLIEFKKNRPLLIVLVTNPKELISEIDHKVFISDGDFLSQDLKFLYRINYGNNGNDFPRLEKINIHTLDVADEIPLKEILVDKEEPISPCNYAYGFSSLNGINRYFIWQADNLVIIDLDRFKKYCLVLPVKIPQDGPQSELLCISQQNPFIYVSGEDGQVFIFNYETFSIKTVAGLSIDPDYGFIVSPNDQWLAYFESNEDQDILGIFELEADS